MTHIEFLGQPGVGKSTLQGRLTPETDWYCASARVASERLLIEYAGAKYRLLNGVIPSPMRSLYETVITNHYKKRALTGFLAEQPAAAKAIFAAVGAVSHQPGKQAQVSLNAIERYQLGQMTLREGETLCLHEGFAMRAAGAIWRDADDGFSLTDFLDRTPTPEMVIHVDAPADVCLERQHERQQLGIAEPWNDGDLLDAQRKFQRSCAVVTDELETRTNVVHIDSTGPLPETVDQLRELVNPDGDVPWAL